MMQGDLLETVKRVVREIEPSADIILYGSQSRGDSRAESDWDFLILVDGPADEARTDNVRHRLYDVEWETGEVISSIVRSRKEWNSPPITSTPFYENVSREGTRL